MADRQEAGLERVVRCDHGGEDGERDEGEDDGAAGDGAPVAQEPAERAAPLPRRDCVLQEGGVRHDGFLSRGLIRT